MYTKSTDIMHVQETRNRFNELSFVLYCSGKDTLTRKPKNYVKTFKVPKELTGKKQIEAYRLKVQLDWKEEVQRLSSGVAMQHKDVRFIDFAREYVENILVFRNDAYNYYRTCKSQLQIVESQLGAYLLSEMTAPVIQHFCKWLCERTFIKTTVTVKVSLKELIKQRKMTFTSVAQILHMAQATLSEALTVGKTISEVTATKLCDYLQVPIKQYYQIDKVEKHYSWSANNGVKTFVHGVLHEAVRQGLISTNFASSEYIRPLSGTKGTKRILDNKDDFMQYIRCIHTEQDIRKRVAFACYVYLGLRNAEVAGLSWSNIDLMSNEIHIVQNTMYVGGFGTVTKSTKSEKSKRVLSIPSALSDILAEYKVWWEQEKINHGDLWADTDKLFVQNNGKDMCGQTLYKWLLDWQEKNGLKRVTPHGLRHSNITFQIANGIDVKTVSARAGHSDIQTTLNIYSHYTKEADKQAASTIDQLLKVE